MEIQTYILVSLVSAGSRMFVTLKVNKICCFLIITIAGKILINKYNYFLF